MVGPRRAWKSHCGQPGASMRAPGPWGHSLVVKGRGGCKNSGERTQQTSFESHNLGPWCKYSPAGGAERKEQGQTWQRASRFCHHHLTVWPGAVASPSRQRPPWARSSPKSHLALTVHDFLKSILGYFYFPLFLLICIFITTYSP